MLTCIYFTSPLIFISFTLNPNILNKVPRWLSPSSNMSLYDDRNVFA